MKSKTFLLAFVMATLVLSLGVTPAWAYFTDWTDANGGLEIKVTPGPSVQEWYKEGVKHVTVGNSETATIPIFARARVLSSLPIEVTSDGNKWYGPVRENGIDWYYYGASETELTEIAPGTSSSELRVKITFPRVKTENEPEGTALIGDSYNVIVYYEGTAALYDEDGNPSPDWASVLHSSSQGGN